MTEPTETTPKIYAAMAAVQKDMAEHGVGKKGKNDQQRFLYRRWDDVQQALAASLARHGVIGPQPRILERQDSELTTAKGTVMHRCILIGYIRFRSAEDGSVEEWEAHGESMDMGDKATSKAITMMVKYAVTHGLCIPLEGLPDADAETPDEAQQTKTAANSRMRSDQDPTWTGPLNKSELKKRSREIHNEVLACTDIAQLDGYIAHEDVKPVIDQLKKDLPEWWEGNADSRGLAGTINDRKNELHNNDNFPGDLPRSLDTITQASRSSRER